MTGLFVLAGNMLLKIFITPTFLKWHIFYLIGKCVIFVLVNWKCFLFIYFYVEKGGNAVRILTLKYRLF